MAQRPSPTQSCGAQGFQGFSRGSWELGVQGAEACSWSPALAHCVWWVGVRCYGDLEWCPQQALCEEPRPETPTVMTSWLVLSSDLRVGRTRNLRHESKPGHGAGGHPHSPLPLLPLLGRGTWGLGRGTWGWFSYKRPVASDGLRDWPAARVGGRQR